LTEGESATLLHEPMISQQHTEELLSRAFITAIAAKAGLNASVNGYDLDYGTDGIIKRVRIHGSQREETGIGIEFQAKATKNWRHTDDGTGVSYDMPVGAYNKLVRRYADGGIPIYLILLCLPPSLDDWIQLSHDELVLRHCCYWQRIAGVESANVISQVVHIPFAQRFDPFTLRLLVREMEEQFK
jgi:hypothetical protein